MDLQSQIALGVLFLLVVVTAAMLFIYPSMRQRRVDSAPFPDQWLHVIRQRLPLYDRLGEARQQELKKLIKRFLDSKIFVGCAGLEITDEIRLTIAAQACLLLLNRPTHEYQQLRRILVYPSLFLVNRDQTSADGLVSHEENVLSGESWSDGKIVLAWDNVRRGVKDFSDGHNVVLHEFAHQLDQETGSANGLPLLYSQGAYKSWARVFSEEFLRLRKDLEAHRQSVLDLYGATDSAEFFAVATETFYEKPWQMAVHHPALFQELKDYYRVDPRQWQPRH